MSVNLTKEEKLSILDKILKSKYFQDSTIRKELLTYLVEQSINNLTPKAITISQELYHNKSFDPSADSYVRSNVYKLRKQLKNYYTELGTEDKYRIFIPKGSYNVQFEENKSDEPIASDVIPNNKYKYPFYVAIGLTFIFALTLIFVLLSKSSKEFHIFWSEFTDSPLPICFAISDMIMYGEVDSKLKRERWILDAEVPNGFELEKFRVENPDREIKDLEFSFSHMSNVPNMLELAPLYYLDKNKNYLKWSTEITWEDLTKNNIIYFGDIRSLQKLQIIFKNLHTKIRQPYTFYWTETPNDTVGVYEFIRSEKYRETFASLAKVPGPNGNTILLITGNDYPARIYLVENLMNNKFLEELYSKYKSQFKSLPKYFEMIIKVRGFKRTGYSSEILKMAKIDKNKFSWNF